jgi:hypothetical protein
MKDSEYKYLLIGLLMMILGPLIVLISALIKLLIDSKII